MPAVQSDPRHRLVFPGNQFLYNYVFEKYCTAAWSFNRSSTNLIRSALEKEALRRLEERTGDRLEILVVVDPL